LGPSSTPDLSGRERRAAPPDAPSTRPEEFRSFLFFTVAMAPGLAVILVAAYGFVVWMVQLVAGPPGS
jgi:nitrate reductase NapE